MFLEDPAVLPVSIEEKLDSSALAPRRGSCEEPKEVSGRCAQLKSADFTL